MEEISDSHMTYARKNFGCAFDKDKSRIFVFGGEVSSNSTTATIEQYTLATDEWLLLKKIFTESPTISPTPEPTNSNYTIVTTSESENITISNITANISTTEEVIEATPIQLAFRRTKHNCILDETQNQIYIFGGGGCSIDNAGVCLDFRNLVEIFDIDTWDIITDSPLLYSAVSDSFSSFSYKYKSTSSNSKQKGSWFNGIFLIGGNTQVTNASLMIQYRIPNQMYGIMTNSTWVYVPDEVSYLIFIMVGILLLITFIGWIFNKVKKYDDINLFSVLIWFLYLMDVTFDFAFNGRLWNSDEYWLAVFSLFFILLRLIYDIGFQLRIELRRWKKDITIRERVREYLIWYMSPCYQYPDSEWFIYIASLLSGSSHGLMHLINSNLFGLSCFNMGLVKRHMIEYNLKRLPLVLCGNIPQLIIQLLFVLEFGSEDTTVLYAGLTTFISLCIGIAHIFIYKNSNVPIRKLMLDEDFTKPYFLMFKSTELGIYKNGRKCIHKKEDLIDCLSQMINVEPQFIEINLCQFLPKTGLKVAFVEYSGTKNASEITNELTKSIQEGWFPKTMKSHWKLDIEPTMEIWDEQAMYQHKQLFTQDLIVNMKTLYNNYGDDNCCNKCYKLFCVCSCCYECCDTLKASSSIRQ